MTTMEVGRKLVDLCREGKNLEAIETLYSPDIVSVEPAAMHNMPAEISGIQAVLGKSKWWIENHEIHAAHCDGPFPHGERFIVRFSYDVTSKPMNQRFKMDEMGLYTVQNGKIVREEFFYAMG